MFIAMNRFRVRTGSEDAFEEVWLKRDTHLEKVPGFVEFHLLKGPQTDDYTLYASHSVWRSRAAFEAWTKSDAFRAAHNRAGENKPLYLDHPQFEGFEVKQTVRTGVAVALPRCQSTTPPSTTTALASRTAMKFSPVWRAGPRDIGRGY